MGFQLPTSTGDPRTSEPSTLPICWTPFLSITWVQKISLMSVDRFVCVKTPPKNGCPVGFVGINGDQINGSYFTDPYFHGIIIN